MSKRVTMVVECGTLALFVMLALRWAWTQNGWFEPYTVLCGCALVAIEFYRRFRSGSQAEESKPPEKPIEAGVPGPPGSGTKLWPVFEIDGEKTLPLFALTAITAEEIPSFSSGKVNLVYNDPDYEIPTYDVSPEWLERIAVDPAEATRMVKAWNNHQSLFAYFIQFRDDSTRQRIKAFHSHTALLSALCDARLGIDTGELWELFDNMCRKEHVYSSYRADPDRQSKYAKYANDVAYFPHITRGISLNFRGCPECGQMS